MSDEVPQTQQPAPPPPPYGYAPFQPPQKSDSKTLAILALVFSLLPLLLLSQIAGLVLAIIHLNIRKGARGMAISAIVLSVVMVFVWGGIFYAIGSSDDSNSTTVTSPAASSGAAATPQPTTSGGAVLVYDVEVGDCGMNPRNAANILYLKLVPCSHPHQFEVYANFSLGSRYPGDSAARRIADRGCSERFASYVGVPPSLSKFGWWEAHGTARTWVGDKDRDVHCFISANSKSLSKAPLIRGSLRGSKK